MNEFIAKKMGEVLAFCQVGQETLTLGQAGLAKVFSNTALTESLSYYDMQAQALSGAIVDNNFKEVMLKKAEATSQKLRTMRDGYVQNAWDDSAEVLEWLGFFEGAAIIHWSLVQGASEQMKNFDLLSLCNKGIKFHQDFLQEVTKAVKSYGSDSAVN